MSKVMMSAIVAALFCVAGSARADQGISSGTLDSMGLSGLSVISDHDGLAIRGMGYSVSDSLRHGKKDHEKNKAEKPWTSVSGKSWASVEIDGHKEEAEAGTHNQYAAEGKYESSGANFSEATLAVVDVHQVDYQDGTTSIETKVHSIHVEAGGFSSAKAF